MSKRKGTHNQHSPASFLSNQSCQHIHSSCNLACLRILLIWIECCIQLWQTRLLQAVLSVLACCPGLVHCLAAERGASADPPGSHCLPDAGEQSLSTLGCCSQLLRSLVLQSVACQQPREEQALVAAAEEASEAAALQHPGL